MPKLLFSDEQKANLAKEAGITGKPDTNTFDKEYDPSTGSYNMYMKLGNGSKFFGAKPTTAQADPADAMMQQVDYVQKQFGGKTYQEIAGAMLQTNTTDKQKIRDTVGTGPGGLYDQLEGITQQIQNLQRQKAGDQSKIFSAVGPDGKPIDPRVAVAQFQASQKALTDNETILRSMQDMYNAQLDSLTTSEYNKQVAINDKNKVALGYLKDQEDKALAEKKLAQDQSQFDATMGLNKDKLAEEKRQANLAAGITSPSDNIEVAVPDIQSFVTKSRGTDLVQCGMVSNDYWKMKTGKSMGIGNSYESKVKAIENAGKSATPVEGGVFALQTGDKTGYGHTGVVKGVNADGSIEVLEANREGSEKGGKMVTHTYSAEVAKKMVFSVAPPSSGSSGKKPKTFNEYIEKADIPEKYNNGDPIEYTTEDIAQIIELAKRDYPTEKEENIVSALKNRSPKSVQKAIEIWDTSEIIRSNLDSITEEQTKQELENLDSKIGDPNKVIEAFARAGFFEKYTSGWLGDDDQYDAVQAYADEKGVDLDKVLENIKGSVK